MYKQLSQLIVAARLISRDQGATIKDIEQNAGISRRSVYRLLDTLENLGYTVYDDYNGRERRIRLNEERERLRWWVPLPKVNLTFEDSVLLCFLLNEANTPALTNQIAQLKPKLTSLIADGGYFMSSTNDTIIKRDTQNKVILHSNKTQKKCKPETKIHINEIIKGIKEKTVCIVTYKAINAGSQKIFRIHPLALFERDGGLYLFVIVPFYGDLRVLAVERIVNIELTEEEFDPPKNFDPEERLKDPFGIIIGKPFTAKIWFSRNQVPYIRERTWPQGSSLIDQQDGSAIFTIISSGAYELKRWVMSFGPAAELLEPGYLRKEIADELASASARYNFSSPKN